MPATDEQRAAFHALFVGMLPQLRTWVRRQGLSQDVDDITSETFTVVWRRWQDLPADPDARRAYVYGIARNKVLAARGARARAAAHDPLLPDHAGDTDVERDVAGTDFVARALATLPPAERDAVAMTVLADLTPTQAASALGCSVSALTSRLHRARNRLQHHVPLARIDPQTRKEEPGEHPSR